MYRCDYHLHTSFSPDCDTPMEKQIQKALELGMDEVCFTDHLELNFRKWAGREIDVLACKKRFDELKEQTKGLTMRFGLEAGVTCGEDYMDELKKNLRLVPLDFVIASAHGVGGTDPFEPEFYEGKTWEESCRFYVEGLYEGLKMMDPDFYCCVGHVDFPMKGRRILGDIDAVFHYKYAADQLDELFRYIVDQGKCLELNMSSFRTLKEGERPQTDWLKRYVELGGEYITIGSDAHIPGHVNLLYDDALALAKSAGVKYLAVFEEMKPKMIPIK